MWFPNHKDWEFVRDVLVSVFQKVIDFLEFFKDKGHL